MGLTKEGSVRAGIPSLAGPPLISRSIGKRRVSRKFGVSIGASYESPDLPPVDDSVPSSVSESLYIITCDIRFGEWDLRNWCESMLEISP